MIRSHRLAVLVSATMLAIVPVTAQVLIAEPAQMPVVDQRFHYLDLMRLAVPDLAQAGDDYRTGKAFALRHISADQNQAVDIAAGTVVASPRGMLAHSGGHRRLVMLLDLGQMQDSAEGIALLALFDIDGQPRLIDTANVAYDRDTGFFDPSKVVGQDGTDTLVLVSGHSNSNQAYQTFVMVDLHGDKLRLIDTVPTLYDNGCSYERAQVPRFKTAGTAAKPAISVSVTETITRRKADCGADPAPHAGKRTISVTYAWQGGRYLRSSDALERLAKETAGRF